MLTEINIIHSFLIYTINLNQKIHFQPNSSKTVHFPIKSSTSLSFKTTKNKTVLPSTPHSNFNKRFNSNFSFMQLHNPIQKYKEEIPPNCSVIIQNITNRIATLPLGCIGYIEIPAIIQIPRHTKSKM